MVYPDGIHPLEARIEALPPAPRPLACESGHGHQGTARLETEGEPAIWLCDSCLRDRGILEVFSRRLIEAAEPATVRLATTRRTLH